MTSEASKDTATRIPIRVQNSNNCQRAVLQFIISELTLSFQQQHTVSILAKNKPGKKYFRKQITVDNILFFYMHL